MLQSVIDDFRQRRIDENAYLNQVTAVMNSVVNRAGDNIPPSLDGHDVAKAYFGIVNQSLAGTISDQELLAEISLAVDEIIERNRIVQWVDNQDVQNKMRLEIEDWLFDYAEHKEFDLDFKIVDVILDQCIDVAKVRRADVS